MLRVVAGRVDDRPPFVTVNAFTFMEQGLSSFPANLAEFPLRRLNGENTFGANRQPGNIR
jgi:hypothetical protein